MKRLWLYSCLLLVAMTGLASAQITFDFTGAGARAEGMGRAYFGIADDASSITWNPISTKPCIKRVIHLSRYVKNSHEYLYASILKSTKLINIFNRILPFIRFRKDSKANRISFFLSNSK